MQKSKIFYRAFRVNYSTRVREIKTDIFVGPASSIGGNPSMFQKFTAIWDTGATGSVITKRVVESMGLTPISKTKVYGVNSEEVCNVYFVDIGLPMKVAFTDLNILECKINSPGVDVLIGMDIIQAGDFALCNPEGKTVFSWCIPSHKNPIDLLEKSNAVNLKLKP